MLSEEIEELEASNSIEMIFFAGGIPDRTNDDLAEIKENN